MQVSVPKAVWSEVHLPFVQSAGGVKKVVKLGVSTEVLVMTTVTGVALSCAVGLCVTMDVITCVLGSADAIFG